MFAGNLLLSMTQLPVILNDWTFNLKYKHDTTNQKSRLK